MKRTYQTIGIQIIQVAEDMIRTSEINNQLDEWDKIIEVRMILPNEAIK